MIDLKAIRTDAEASEKMGITCEVEPATIIALLDRLEAAEVEVTEQARILGISAEKELALISKLEAAEKDAARKVIRVKLGDQYGNDLNGHWFYLHPVDDEAKKVLDNRSMKK